MDRQNKLTINVKKTIYLAFTSFSNNLPNMRPLNIGKYEIPETIRYLGVIVDRHL